MNYVLRTMELAVESVPETFGELNTVAYHPDGRVVVIVDLEGMSWGSLNLQWLGQMADLLILHYPERVWKIHVFHSGTLMVAAWSILQRILSPTTQRKIEMIEAESTTAELLEIAPEWIESWIPTGEIQPPFFDAASYTSAEILFDAVRAARRTQYKNLPRTV